MKLLIVAVLFISTLAGTTTGASAQPVQAKQGQLPPEEVIKRFTAKESELLDEWKNYAYQQETKFQVLGPANIVSGEFYQVSEFVFTDAGKRLERILKAPPSTLDQTGLRMGAEDRNALINLQPFALTVEQLENYNVTFIAKEKIDDLTTYVFDVKPKALADARLMKQMKDQKIEGKYFQGRIWVDDVDLQIVKTAGKIVPEFEQRFPKFETYRENIDGRFWFPTFTTGDDTLVFEDKKGRVTASYNVRQVIRYKNYRRFSGEANVKEIFEEQEQPTKPDTTAKDTPKPTTTNTKPTNGTSGNTESKSQPEKAPAATKQAPPKKP